MTPIREFEEHIQKTIHPDLRVRINLKGAPDAAGVFIGKYYIGVTLPSRGVLPYRDERYQDKNGVVWRSQIELERHIKAKLRKFFNDLNNGAYD